MMRRLSLGSRLALLFAACTAAVSLTAGLLFSHASKHHFVELDQQLLGARLSQLRSQLAGVDSADKLAARLPALRGELSHQADLALRIRGAEGELWFQSRPGLPEDA
ncbi:MAG: two-component sensor histidine kinase, partial [Gammaproteobacteria bacterium]